MGNRRLALIVGALLCSSSSTFAQPAEGEIEMEGDPEPAPTSPDQNAQPPSDQPPPIVKDPKVAKKWQQAGDQLMKKGDYLTGKGKPDAKTMYENAVTAYQHAIEASDDASLNYQLALAEDKAGMTPDALKHLKVVLAAQGIKPAITKNAQAKLDELSMKVGVVTLTIAPDGTQVSIEGKQVGEAPMTEPLVLMPGVHKVSLTAVGFQPKDVELKIEAGSESERKIALEPVPVVNKQQVEEPEPIPVAAPKGPDKRPLYIGGGIGAGFILVATVTGIVAITKHGTYTDDNATPAERADAQSSGKTFAHVTDFCIVGAVAAGAFTAYWYQYKYRPQARALSERQQPQTEAKVDVVPWVQPEAGGLSVAGRF
ncbi:MAG TPA: PEGA domain-containing protein [Kofleriaceae bacterium]|nr:PEGA domain-containing protein [Kofleriaceae bacterium]